MAFRMQDFKCPACEQVEEQLVKAPDKDQQPKAESACAFCGETAEKMEPVISIGNGPKRHVSWSKWSI